MFIVGQVRARGILLEVGICSRVKTGLPYIEGRDAARLRTLQHFSGATSRPRIAPSSLAAPTRLLDCSDLESDQLQFVAVRISEEDLVLRAARLNSTLFEDAPCLLQRDSVNTDSYPLQSWVLHSGNGPDLQHGVSEEECLGPVCKRPDTWLGEDLTQEID